MKAESTFSRLALVSPWPLLIFIVIPFLVILSITKQITIPLAGSPTSLLINNICFASFVLCRLLRYLVVMGRSIRYGKLYKQPEHAVTLTVPAVDVRSTLSRAGYFFNADGSYGEKRDLGYFGTILLYGGLFVLLSVGCWDNLQQFHGVLLDGMGPSTNLNKVESYRSITKGSLAATPASLPQMQIVSQMLPDSMYPRGATEVIFKPDDGNAEKMILKPGSHVTYSGYDIDMTKIVFEPQIVITTKDSKTLYDALVRIDPLVQKRGVYSFYGLFQGAYIGGGVYYQPEKNSFMVVITRGDKKVVTDLVFQVDQKVTAGDYIISCAKLGQWSEIHVIHRRHKSALITAALVALFGLLVRIMICPQRVWLEESGERSRISSVGVNIVGLLGAEG